MKNKLIAVGKLLVVAALFWWVFTSVQWRDEYVITDAQDEVVETHTGTFVGPWDGAIVRFETDDGVVVERPTGPLDGDRRAAAAPGLVTYFIGLDKPLFALGALCYLVTLMAAALRWWWLLRVNDLRVSPGEAIRFTWIGVFFNNVVPGQTGGDVVKALYIAKRCPGKRVEGLMSVLVDRILGLGSLALLGAVLVLFQLDRFGAVAAVMWGVLALVAAIGGFAFSRRLRRLIRLDQLLRALPPRLSGALMRIDSAVFFYRGHKTGVLVWLLIGVGNHVITVASFYLMGEALGVGMPADEYFVLIPVILMVSAVPLSPNGWGVGEALFGTLFGKFGAIHLGAGVVDPEQVMRTRGVALSVLYRLHTTLWSLIGGAMILFDRDRVTKAEFDAEIEREHREEVELAEHAGEVEAG